MSRNVSRPLSVRTSSAGRTSPIIDTGSDSDDASYSTTSYSEGVTPKLKTKKGMLKFNKGYPKSDDVSEVLGEGLAMTLSKTLYPDLEVITAKADVCTVFDQRYATSEVSRATLCLHSTFETDMVALDELVGGNRSSSNSAVLRQPGGEGLCAAADVGMGYLTALNLLCQDTDTVGKHAQNKGVVVDEGAPKPLVFDTVFSNTSRTWLKLLPRSNRILSRVPKWARNLPGDALRHLDVRNVSILNDTDPAHRLWSIYQLVAKKSALEDVVKEFKEGVKEDIKKRFGKETPCSSVEAERHNQQQSALLKRVDDFCKKSSETLKRRLEGFENQLKGLTAHVSALSAGVEAVSSESKGSDSAGATTAVNKAVFKQLAAIYATRDQLGSHVIRRCNPEGMPLLHVAIEPTDRLPTTTDIEVHGDDVTLTFSNASWQSSELSGRQRAQLAKCLSIEVSELSQKLEYSSGGGKEVRLTLTREQLSKFNANTLRDDPSLATPEHGKSIAELLIDIARIDRQILQTCGNGKSEKRQRDLARLHALKVRCVKQCQAKVKDEFSAMTAFDAEKSAASMDADAVSTQSASSPNNTVKDILDLSVEKDVQVCTLKRLQVILSDPDTGSRTEKLRALLARLKSIQDKVSRQVKSGSSTGALSRTQFRLQGTRTVQAQMIRRFMRQLKQFTPKRRSAWCGVMASSQHRETVRAAMKKLSLLASYAEDNALSRSERSSDDIATTFADIVQNALVKPLRNSSSNRTLAIVEHCFAQCSCQAVTGFDIVEQLRSDPSYQRGAHFGLGSGQFVSTVRAACDRLLSALNSPYADEATVEQLWQGLIKDLTQRGSKRALASVKHHYKLYQSSCSRREPQSKPRLPRAISASRRAEELSRSSRSDSLVLPSVQSARC